MFCEFIQDFKERSVYFSGPSTGVVCYGLWVYDMEKKWISLRAASKYTVSDTKFKAFSNGNILDISVCFKIQNESIFLFAHVQKKIST